MCLLSGFFPKVKAKERKKKSQQDGCRGPQLLLFEAQRYEEEATSEGLFVKIEDAKKVQTANSEGEQTSQRSWKQKIKVRAKLNSVNMDRRVPHSGFTMIHI